MRTSGIRMIAMLCFALAAPLVAQAQSGPQRIIETIDVKVLNSEIVAIGTITKVTRRDRQHADVSIAVEETLKGAPQLTLQRSVDPQGAVGEMLKLKPRVLLAGQDLTFLDPQKLSVAVANGSHIYDPNKVIEYVREVLRTHPGVSHIATYTLEGKIVPLDSRLEAWAFDNIRTGRTEGFDVLKSFQSAQNIELLKGLLDNPKFGTLSPENNHGIEVRTYDVRRKAYEMLKAWGVDVASPVLREEITKLDTVERLSWLGPVDTAAFQKLAEAKKLKVLEFPRDDLSDAQMALVGRISSLTQLKVGDQITDAGLKELRGLTNLVDLNLSTSRITDKGLAELAALPNLKNLTLQETRASDDGLQTLVRIPSLKWVDVTLTRMTKEGVAEARRMHPGVTIVDTSYYSTQDYLASHTFQGDVDNVRGDLEWHKIDPNRITHGTPAIFYAVSQNHVGIVRMLLNHKARVDIVDAGNSTPLQWAARYGYISIMKLLLDRGADVNHADENGNTALHFATRNGSAEAIRVLRDAGAR